MVCIDGICQVIDRPLLAEWIERDSENVPRVLLEKVGYRYNPGYLVGCHPQVLQHDCFAMYEVLEP